MFILIEIKTIFLLYQPHISYCVTFFTTDRLIQGFDIQEANSTFFAIRSSILSVARQHKFSALCNTFQYCFGCQATQIQCTLQYVPVFLRLLGNTNLVHFLQMTEVFAQLIGNAFVVDMKLQQKLFCLILVVCVNFSFFISEHNEGI